MFRSKNKKLLLEARDEVNALSLKLSKAEETIDHLRHLLGLKTEECKMLSDAVERMRKKVEYAELVEEKVSEIEEQVNHFAALKKSMELKISRLREERNQARNLLKAKNHVPPPIEFVDTGQIEIHSPRTQRKPPAKSPREKESLEGGDWYVPLPDD